MGVGLPPSSRLPPPPGEAWDYPVKTRHRPNAGLILAHHLRCWANISSAQHGFWYKPEVANEINILKGTIIILPALQLPKLIKRIYQVFAKFRRVYHSNNLFYGSPNVNVGMTKYKTIYLTSLFHCNNFELRVFILKPQNIHLSLTCLNQTKSSSNFQRLKLNFPKLGLIITKKSNLCFQSFIIKKLR